MKWIFSATVSAVLASSLILSGCGDDSSSDACAYGVQQNLDQGNYDAVIATLDTNGTCGGELTQNEAWLNLAAAYMGKGGLTIGNLLGAVTDSNSTSAMSSFMKSFGATATAAGLANMKKAKTVYGYIDSSCSTTKEETGAAAEACLYSGMVTLTETIGSLSAIIGSDTLALISTTLTSTTDTDSDGVADQLEITGCAITDAIGSLGGCSGNGTTIPSVVNCTTATPTFTSTNTSYSCRKYTLNSNIGYKLISGTTVLTTEGYSTTDGTTCATPDGSTCFPKPMVVDGTTTTVTSGLLTLINDPTTFSSLSVWLPADNGVEANITADLIDSIEGAGGDNNITEAELAAFLNSLK